MANIFTDASFEDGSTAHLFNAGASQSALIARTGTYSAILPWLALQATAGVWRQAPTLQYGSTYTMRAWVNGEFSALDPLDALTSTSFDASLGIVTTFGTPFVGDSAAWELWEPGSITWTAGMGSIGARFDAGLVGRRVFLDDVELELVGVGDMGKWTAISALQTALKTIAGSGAGFNSTLSNRVYTKLITPVEEPNMTLPYICIPLDEDDERPEWNYKHVMRTYRIPFYGFVSEDMGDKWESAAAQAASNLIDDIYKVILNNQTLSGAVEDVKVAAVMSQCGVLPDATFGEIKGYFEIMQAHQASDLGV